MTENTTNAFEEYRKKISPLNEGETYDCDFTLKGFMFQDDIKITSVKFKCYVGAKEVSPILKACFNNDEAELYFADEKFISDGYDKMSIMKNYDDMVSMETYDIKLFKKMLDKMKLKK